MMMMMMVMVPRDGQTLEGEGEGNFVMGLDILYYLLLENLILLETLFFFDVLSSPLLPKIQQLVVS